MTAKKLTAEELAVKKEMGNHDRADDAAEMLRQQQAEIGRLKQIIDANYLNQNIGQFVKPVNEPVAWKHKPSGIIFDEIIESSEPDDLVPLYEHPMRYLTDEKIWKLWQTHLNDDITVFARAIEKRIKNGN